MNVALVVRLLVLWVFLAKDGTNAIFRVLAQVMRKVDAWLPAEEDGNQYPRHHHHVACGKDGAIAFLALLENGGNVALIVSKHLYGRIFFWHIVSIPNESV